MTLQQLTDQPVAYQRGYLFPWMSNPYPTETTEWNQFNAGQQQARADGH